MLELYSQQFSVIISAKNLSIIVTLSTGEILSYNSMTLDVDPSQRRLKSMVISELLCKLDEVML